MAFTEDDLERPLEEEDARETFGLAHPYKMTSVEKKRYLQTER
jgi:hypothetical protein